MYNSLKKVDDAFRKGSIHERYRRKRLHPVASAYKNRNEETTLKMLNTWQSVLGQMARRFKKERSDLKRLVIFTSIIPMLGYFSTAFAYVGDLDYTYSAYEISILDQDSKNIQVNLAHPPPTPEEVALAYIRAQVNTNNCRYVNKFRCEYDQGTFLKLAPIYDDVKAITLYGCVKKENDNQSHGQAYYCHFDIDIELNVDAWSSLRRGSGSFLTNYGLDQLKWASEERSKVLKVSELYMSREGWHSKEFIKYAEIAAELKTRAFRGRARHFACTQENRNNFDWELDEVCSSELSYEEKQQGKKEIKDEKNHHSQLLNLVGSLDPNKAVTENFSPSSIKAYKDWNRTWNYKPILKLFNTKFQRNPNGDRPFQQELKSQVNYMSSIARNHQLKGLPFSFMRDTNTGEVLYVSQTVGTYYKKGRAYDRLIFKLEKSVSDHPELMLEFKKYFKQFNKYGLDYTNLANPKDRQAILEYFNNYNDQGQYQLAIDNLPAVLVSEVRTNSSIEPSHEKWVKFIASYKECKRAKGGPFVNCGCFAVNDVDGQSSGVKRGRTYPLDIMTACYDPKSAEKWLENECKKRWSSSFPNTGSLDNYCDCYVDNYLYEIGQMPAVAVSGHALTNYNMRIKVSNACAKLQR